MLRIAVCDDETKIAAELKRQLDDILARLGIRRRIDVFHSAVDLRDSLEAGARFDLFFLDIYFADGEINGVDAGRIVRGECGRGASIVYISWENRPPRELFGIRPIDLLSKPLTREKIEEAVATHMADTSLSEGLFRYSKNGASFSEPIKDIVYFESRKRKTIMHLRDGQLAECDFHLVHASFLVNFGYIRSINYKSMSVEGREDPLPISHNRRVKVRERLMEIATRTPHPPQYTFHMRGESR